MNIMSNCAAFHDRMVCTVERELSIYSFMTAQTLSEHIAIYLRFSLLLVHRVLKKVRQLFLAVASKWLINLCKMWCAAVARMHYGIKWYMVYRMVYGIQLFLTIRLSGL